MAKGWLDIGRQIEFTRGNLQRLSAQVKAADEIFTRSAREGERLGLRALGRYTLAHGQINEIFSHAATNWTHGFSAVEKHAQGAAGHLFNFAKEMAGFHASRVDVTSDYHKALTTQRELQQQIRDAEHSTDLYLKQDLQLRKDIADKAAVLGNWEVKWLEVRKALVPLTIMWGATVGRVLENSFELQRNFRDVNLNFSQSVETTRSLLTAVGRSQGLVTLKEATEAARTLRSYSREFFDDPKLIRQIATFHELTGVSTDSVAKIVYQLKAFGGEKPDVTALTNSFTFFARETDLGAAGVSEMLGKMQPLITSYPKELRSTLITQVLALGDAFKTAGLNADEMLKRIEEMQDLTSAEGRRTAGLIGSQTGISPLQLMTGNMDPSQIALQWTVTQRKLMRQLTAGGRLNPQTAASILSSRFGGSVEEWKIAGGKTEKQMGDMADQMIRDKNRAEHIDNLHKAFDELTSGPVAKLSALLSSLNLIMLDVGTNLLKGIKSITDFVHHQLPGVSGAMHRLFLFFTDEKRGGFQWGIRAITAAIAILTPILTVRLFLGLIGVIGAGKTLIGTFRKAALALDLASEAALRNAKVQEKIAAEQTEFSFMGNKEVTKLETEAVTGGGKGIGGIFKTVLKALGITKLPGLKNILGPTEKIAGEGLGEVAAKGGMEMLGKGAGKVLTKGLTSFAPWLGEIVSLGFAAMDMFKIITDPKESIWNKIWKSALKLVGGVLGGLTPLGFGVSMLIDLLVGPIEKNTDATEKSTEEEKKKREGEDKFKHEPIKNVFAGGGSGLRSGVSDAYQRAGVTPPGGTPVGVPSGAPGGGPGAGGVSQSAAAAPGALTTGANNKVDPGALKNYLQERFSSSGLVGVVPPDGANWGINTGSAEEWASFGLAVAKQESGLNPSSENKSDPGGSVGLFQFGQGQTLFTGGRDQLDPQASADAFVKCVQYYVAGKGGNSISAMGATFGSIRRPNEAGQYLGYAQGVSGAPTGGYNAAAYRAALAPSTSVASRGGPNAGSFGANSGAGAIPQGLGGGPAGGGLGTAAVMAQGMNTPGADPNLGCAASVSAILNQNGYNLPSTQSTSQLYTEMVQAGYQPVPPGTPGSVIISPTEGTNHGHTGIVGSDGRIYSNSSRSGRWEGNYTVASWMRYFGGKGLKTYSFMPTGGGVPGGGGAGFDAASVLGNSQVQDHLENLVTREGRRGKVPLRAGGFESTEAVFTPSSGEYPEIPGDRHGKAVLAELQASNRMNKERLHYLRQQRFLGPTLLPSAAEDTLTNA